MKTYVYKTDFSLIPHIEIGMNIVRGFRVCWAGVCVSKLWIDPDPRPHGTERGVR